MKYLLIVFAFMLLATQPFYAQPDRFQALSVQLQPGLGEIDASLVGAVRGFAYQTELFYTHSRWFAISGQLGAAHAASGLNNQKNVYIFTTAYDNPEVVSVSKFFTGYTMYLSPLHTKHHHVGLGFGGNLLFIRETTARVQGYFPEGNIPELGDVSGISVGLNFTVRYALSLGKCTLGLKAYHHYGSFRYSSAILASLGYTLWRRT